MGKIVGGLQFIFDACFVCNVLYQDEINKMQC